MALAAKLCLETRKGNEIADEAATATATVTPSYNNPNENLNSTPDYHVVADESSPLLIGRDQRRVVERKGKITLAALYAVQVFYSFFIM